MIFQGISKGILFRIRTTITVNKCIYHKYHIIWNRNHTGITSIHTPRQKWRKHSHRNTHGAGHRESDDDIANETTVDQRRTSATDARRTDRRRRRRGARKISENGGSSAASLPPTTLFAYVLKCTESIVSLNDDNRCISSDLFHPLHRTLYRTNLSTSRVAIISYRYRSFLHIGVSIIRHAVRKWYNINNMLYCINLRGRIIDFV